MSEALGRIGSMKDLGATLAALDAALGGTVNEALSDHGLRVATDESLLEVMAVAARVARRAEALLIEGAAQIDYRSSVPVRDERMSTRFGCRSAGELVQRVTQVSSRSAADLVKAGRAVIRETAPSSGEVLPADYPAMRAALAAGHIGVDGVLAVTAPLAGVASAAGRAALLAAEEELAAASRGEGVDGAPAACADDLRALATVWAMYLDQDGAEPRERVALRRRGVTFGVCRDGVVPFHGNLLADVAAQFELVADSILNPKVDDVPMPTGPWFTDEPDTEAETFADRRTRAQKLHDVFAMVLERVAGSGVLPTLGGAAPTLVVSVRAEDLQNGSGYAHLHGCDEPVSVGAARQIACCGAVQRVTSDDRGRIVSIETSDRVFNHRQRLAIALRDGGCVIPGCHVDASWCEIHHVHEHARGGPTHTDNGVLLCWHHHRTLDAGGWKVRMRDGIPEVRGPTWWDGSGQWRPITKSPVRMRERFALRT